MPTSFDKTYHFKYSEPNYDSEIDKEDALIKRVEEMIYEENIPPLPTREQEIAYLDWLEEDIKKDPLIGRRMYKSSPSRVPFKNYRDLKSRYNMSWYCMFLLGVFISWPLAIKVGRNYRYTT